VTVVESVIAWRPFLEPMNAHGVWFVLLVPLAFGMSVAYKAVRTRRLSRYWREVVVMTAQIVSGMIGLGLAAYIFLVVVAPLIAPMPG